jgi:hypothetical protein
MSYFFPVALDYLNDLEKEYIRKIVFGRGINLSYRQFGQMIYFVFEADDFPTIPFVQRLNVTNVINGRLVSHSIFVLIHSHGFVCYF